MKPYRLRLNSQHVSITYLRRERSRCVSPQIDPSEIKHYAEAQGLNVTSTGRGCRKSRVDGIAER